MKKINKNIITNINGLVDISLNSSSSKINNIQSLVVEKKISDYKGIYKYNVEYVQNSNNKNVIDIDEGITIYSYYKEFYKNYKNYDIRSFLLQIKIIIIKSRKRRRVNNRKSRDNI